MEIFGLRGCTNTKVLLKRLCNDGISFQFIDLKENSPGINSILTWINQLGTEKILNKQSTTWRSLSPDMQKQVTDAPSVARLIHDFPTLIKRPLINRNGKYFTGIKEPGLSDFLNQ